MEERVKQLEQRVNFLESTIVRILASIDSNTKVDEEQTKLLKKIVGLIEEDRTAIKALAGIKV